MYILRRGDRSLTPSVPTPPHSIKRLLADRLEQCGWRDAVASLAAAELARSDADAPVTAPRLAAALADRAREAVPDGVKAQFLETLRGLLVN